MLTPREIASHAPDLSGENLLINGDFRISQRGDYDTAPVAWTSGYWLDRFLTFSSVVNFSIQRLSTNQRVVGKKSARLTASSTTSGYFGTAQWVEKWEESQLQEVTISGWVKSNTPNARLMINYGVWSTIDASHSGNGQWEYLQGTFQLPAGQTALLGGAYVRGADGSAVSVTIGDYIEVSDFKLEYGSVATPFVSRSNGEELALCQRYYIKMPVSGVVTGLTDSAMAGREFPVEMRTTPTVTNPCLNSNYVSSAPSTGQWSLQKVGVNSAIKGGTITRSSVPTVNAANLVWWGGAWSTVSDYLNGPGLYLEADAEL